MCSNTHKQCTNQKGITTFCIALFCFVCSFSKLHANSLHNNTTEYYLFLLPKLKTQIGCMYYSSNYKCAHTKKKEHNLQVAKFNHHHRHSQPILHKPTIILKHTKHSSLPHFPCFCFLAINHPNLSPSQPSKPFPIPFPFSFFLCAHEQPPIMTNGINCFFYTSPPTFHLQEESNSCTILVNQNWSPFLHLLVYNRIHFTPTIPFSCLTPTESTKQNKEMVLHSFWFNCTRNILTTKIK